MKTQTYIDFKNFVKTNCVTPYNDVKKDGYKLFHYDGDSAHMIYSAWYMLKHNLTDEQREEYIIKDFEAAKKHFSSSGCYGHCCILKPDAKKTEGKYGSYYDNDQYDLQVRCDFCGDAYISLPKWKEAVNTIYNYWKTKLDNEIKAQ